MLLLIATLLLVTPTSVDVPGDSYDVINNPRQALWRYTADTGILT